MKDEFKDEEGVLIRKANVKPRVLLSKLYLLIHGEVKKYTDIFPDEGKRINEFFCYAYVDVPVGRDVESTRSNFIIVNKDRIIELIKK